MVSLASFLIAILIIEAGVSTAVVSFIATTILGFIVVPNKVLVLPYALLFGYYGIIKFYIETIDNAVLEWIIKIVIFNIVIVIEYFLLTKLITNEINLPFHIGFIVLALQIVFIAYDHVFSMFIQYYNTNIRKHIR